MLLFPLEEVLYREITISIFLEVSLKHYYLAIAIQVINGAEVLEQG